MKISCGNTDGCRLLDLVQKAQCRSVAVVGLAKNTGKTVTLNRIIAEAARDRITILLASFGHDGEYRDSLTDHRKPSITVPTGTYYATVEPYAGPPARRELIGETSFSTPFGPVRLYRSVVRVPDNGAQDEEATPYTVQLLGLNRVSYIRRLMEDRRISYDLFLVDGALDRRSTAVSTVADGIIIATGPAAVSRERATPSGVAAVTAELIAPFLLPQFAGTLPGAGIAERGSSSFMRIGGTWREMPLVSWLTGEIDPALSLLAGMTSDDALLLGGALTDSAATRLLAIKKLQPGMLVVRDGTRVFLSPGVRKRLSRRGWSLQILEKMPILAITVNPWDPRGYRLKSDSLRQAIGHVLPDTIPVLDPMDPSYPGL